MTRRIRGILFIIVAAAGFAAATLNEKFEIAGLGTGVVFLFLAATAFSKAGQLAESLRPFVKTSMRFEVWGAPLPTSGNGIFEIDSIVAFGAALLIHLRERSGGPRLLLKVAQPSSANFAEGRIEIGNAAYVSWARTKLKAGEGATMPALTMAR